MQSACSPIEPLHHSILENTGDFKSVFRAEIAKSFFQQGGRVEVRRQELCHMSQKKPPAITGTEENQPPI